MKNLGLKIFSVIAALALNYYVNSENHIAVVGFSAPIRVSNIPEDKILVWPLSPRVDVTIKGPSYLVSQVVTSNLLYDLTLPPQIGNTFRTGLVKSALNLPPSVEVVSIQPTEIDLSFDRAIEREIPVIVPRYGNTPDNLKVTKMEVVPANVKVQGPEQEIKKLKAIETAPVDLRDATESFERTLPLRAPGNLIKISPAQVEFKVEMVGVFVTKKFENIPLEVRGGVGTAYETIPPVVSIEISGPADLTERIKRDDLIPFIRPKFDQKIGDNVPVNIQLPEGLSLKNLAPVMVQIQAVTKGN